MLTVKQIAEAYGVTHVAVRKWIEAGCPHETQRPIGAKDRIVMDKAKVDEWLKTTPKRNV